MDNMIKGRDFHYKLIIKREGDNFIGPGRVELLKRIGAHGSIAKAAEDMQMSYRKAWALIKDLNRISQAEVVVRQKGGKEGGGASLTPAGKRLIERYEALVDQLEPQITQAVASFWAELEGGSADSRGEDAG